MLIQPNSTLSAAIQGLDSHELLDSLPDGAYITDRARQIVYWNRAAERITGWSSGEVVGRHCHDNILVHIDKDGHPLCGREFCPLHRSMVTATASEKPILIFAKSKGGKRIPVEVSVAPLHDECGAVIGGIEVFRDIGEGMDDLMHAKAIQSASLMVDLPKDKRVGFDVCYTPCDIVGGDFFRMESLDGDRYGVLVADIMGHGVASALYTMQLDSLWGDLRESLWEPARFMGSINERLFGLVRKAGYFATGVYGVYDAGLREFRCVRAGASAPLLFREQGGCEEVGEASPALGLMPGVEYVESTVKLGVGDVLLLYTDGATEVFDSGGFELGMDGLKRIVSGLTGKSGLGGLRLRMLETQLLGYSNNIRLDDDLTLLKIAARSVDD